MKPGRLYITCHSALNIRERADGQDSNECALTPHLLFKIPSKGIPLPIHQSRIGVVNGHDVKFDNEVVFFNVANPEQLLIDGDVSLIVQLRDGLKGLIAQCKVSISQVLSSGGEIVHQTSHVLNPGDTSTNSKVSLTFFYVEANPGLLKLDLSMLKKNGVCSSKRYISVASPDGQSKTSSLADSSTLQDGFSIWVDEKNWFGELDLEIHEDSVDQVIGEGKLVVMDCLKSANECDDSEMISSLIPMSWDRNTNVDLPSVSVGHKFLLAGIVRIKSINVNDVRAAVNPRVVVKAGERVQMTASPTIVTDSSLSWENQIDVPVVSESNLTVEFGNFDSVVREFELLGSSLLDLLPLYQSANMEISVDLTRRNDIGEELDGGNLSISLEFVFEGPTNIAFPRDKSTVQSFVPCNTDPAIETDNYLQTDSYSELDIRQAFNKIDLDKNGYIGAKELRHCLTCMGENVTDAEIDMMISMLDKGNGMVNFRSFLAMATSPDPSKDDFSYLHAPTRSSKPGDNMHGAFAKHLQRNDITKVDVLKAWDRLKRYAQSSTSKFQAGYEQLQELIPQFGNFSELFDLLRAVERNGEIDGRSLIMCFASMIFSSAEKCEFAFDLYDIDGNGQLFIDQIQSLLTCTHFSNRNLKKKATNLLRLAGDANSWGVSKQALALAAEKFPNLVFPKLQQEV